MARKIIKQEVVKEEIAMKSSTQSFMSFLQKWFGVGLALLAAFLIGVLWTEVRYLKNGYATPTVPTAAQPQQQQAPTEPQAPQEVILTDEQWNEILKDAPAQIGKDDAPVTMVEFTDFQCPFCERFYTDTYVSLVKKYVDTGKLKVVFRNLPLSFHPNAHISSQAAACAGDQGKYVEMHDILFKNQTAWANDPTDTVAKNFFEKYAQELGMNTEKFMSCISNGDKKALVDADLALATKVGASGTPTFYINKKQLVGAQPIAAFEAELDALLQ